jgi:quercetin dioxygenase-like cupin family protein
MGLMMQSSEYGRAPFHIVRPDEGALGSLRILAGVEQTRGGYFAFESETPPHEAGAVLDVHAHARYDESEYVLTGEREIVIDDEQWHATSGFFALAPRHARHGMRTIGSAPSRWLHFFSPAEIERYFIERERLRDAGASADELQALSGSYGVGAAHGAQVSEPVFASSTTDGLVVDGTQTRNAYALAEPGFLPDYEHSHGEQEEAFYVIEGELTVETDGMTLTATRRSFVLVPRGLRHRHLAAPGARLLAVYSPGHLIPHELHNKG